MGIIAVDRENGSARARDEKSSSVSRSCAVDGGYIGRVSPLTGRVLVKGRDRPRRRLNAAVYYAVVRRSGRQKGRRQ